MVYQGSGYHVEWRQGLPVGTRAYGGICWFRRMERGARVVFPDTQYHVVRPGGERCEWKQEVQAARCLQAAKRSGVPATTLRLSPFSQDKWPFRCIRQAYYLVRSREHIFFF